MPHDPGGAVRRSSAETALDSPVSSRTRAEPPVTLVTVPTRPAAVTTGASTSTPSSEPAETTIVWSKALRRARDHLGRDAVEVGGERRGALVVEEVPSSTTLRCSADSFWITCCCSCSFSARRRSFSERASSRLFVQPYASRNGSRHALDRHLERLQHAGDGAWASCSGLVLLPHGTTP